MKKPNTIPSRILLPNMITIAGLCAGLTAIRFAFQGNMEMAFFAVLVAAVCDGLDGTVARAVKGTSQFGVELDSLADMVSFGVAPAFMLYMWVLSDVPRFGWAVCLLYVVCSALRLARFNVDDSSPKPIKKAYFTGVPMPMAAYLVLSPLMLLKGAEDHFFAQPNLVMMVVIAVSALMVSKIPTFSPKSIKLPFWFALPAFLGVALAAAFMLTDPWLTLAGIGGIYVLLLPVSYYVALKRP